MSQETLLFLLFSYSVVSDYLRPHYLQHTRLPCPLLSPRVCSNSCPLSWWCHPTISSSAALFYYLQSFPASEFFPMSALCIRWPKCWSFSFSISSSAESDFFRIYWFDLLAVHGILKSLLHHNLKASILWRSAFFMVQFSHLYMTTGKTIALTMWSKWCHCFSVCCLGLS